MGLGFVHLAPVGGAWRVRHFLQLYRRVISGRSLWTGPGLGMAPGLGADFALVLGVPLGAILRVLLSLVEDFTVASCNLRRHFSK